MKYFLLTIFAFCGANLLETSAQTRQNSVQVKTEAPALDDTELDLDQAFADHLQAIVTASNGMKNEVYMDFINECTYAEMLMGMVSHYTKRDLDGTYVAKNPQARTRIQSLSGQVNALIAEAQDLRRICTDGDDNAGPNGKCCKQSGKADESDVCNTAKNKTCKLVGREVKQCSATSDECESSKR